MAHKMGYIFSFWLQEQEKKAAKKRGSASTPVTNNSEEQTDGAVEPEMADPIPESPVAEKKVVVQKEKTSTVRYRGKPRESIPKIIPKRKKSTNYGVWGASAAAVALVVILVALGYYYLL